MAALSLEFREEIQYGDEDDEPSNRYDGWRYTQELISRGGLLGPFELAISSSRYGSTDAGAAASLAGPTVGHFINWLQLNRSLPAFIARHLALISCRGSRIGLIVRYSTIKISALLIGETWP